MYKNIDYYNNKVNIHSAVKIKIKKHAKKFKKKVLKTAPFRVFNVFLKAILSLAEANFARSAYFHKFTASTKNECN